MMTIEMRLHQIIFPNFSKEIELDRQTQGQTKKDNNISVYHIICLECQWQVKKRHIQTEKHKISYYNISHLESQCRIHACICFKSDEPESSRSTGCFLTHNYSILKMCISTKIEIGTLNHTKSQLLIKIKIIQNETNQKHNIHNTK